MSILVGALLGLVQGLCEFLPVSSSGHLVLLQNIFGISEGSLFLDSALHLGTLVAVFVVYRKQIWELIKHPIQKKVGLLLLSTAVTTAIAFVFRDAIEKVYEGALLGFGFLATSLILVLGEWLAHGKKDIGHMTIPQSLGVGLVQGIAILPGISRSGSTITGSRFFGLDKDAAAEFSFLLSIPAILGSLVLQVPEVLKEDIHTVPWAALAVGIVVAGVSGYFAIRLMLKLIREKSLIGFAIYTGVLGALVLLDQLVFNVFFQPLV